MTPNDLKPDDWRAAIQSAAHTQQGRLHRTPVLTSRLLNDMAGVALFLKCENMQKTGSFKARGALNAVMGLHNDQRERGVVTHSSGNFGQALAWACREAGAPAVVVMPSNAPKGKVAAVKGYGAKVVHCVPTLQARESTTQEIIEQSGATFLHPFDNPDVIFGHGTITLELAEQAPALDAVVVPLGGGGLISGVALGLGAMGSATVVVGAEPEGADDAYRSKKEGKLLPQENPNTIADGLLTSMGRHTWPVIRDRVSQVVTVSDDEIVAAMRAVWSRMKLVIEPSSAAAVAVALKTSVWQTANTKRVGVVVSGGNVDFPLRGPPKDAD